MITKVLSWLPLFLCCNLFRFYWFQWSLSVIDIGINQRLREFMATQSIDKISFYLRASELFSCLLSRDDVRKWEKYSHLSEERRLVLSKLVTLLFSGFYWKTLSFRSPDFESLSCKSHQLVCIDTSATGRPKIFAVRNVKKDCNILHPPTNFTSTYVLFLIDQFVKLR